MMMRPTRNTSPSSAGRLPLLLALAVLAAPIVADVIKSYFDKRLRTSPQQLLTQLPMFGPLNTGHAPAPARAVDPFITKIPMAAGAQSQEEE